MQQEMGLLKEEVLATQSTGPPIIVHDQRVDLAAVEEIWRGRIEEVSSERQILIEKVGLWERKYEELYSLFEAKLESKEETINLLSLKISNLEMGRSRSNCACYYQPRHC
jgi:hypothetical protein